MRHLSITLALLIFNVHWWLSNSISSSTFIIFRYLHLWFFIM